MNTRRALWVALVFSGATVGCGAKASPKATDQQAAGKAAASTKTTFDPCALLTSDEIKATLGWAPDSTERRAYGTTGNCNYIGPNAMTQRLSIIVGQGMPDMSSSKKMADWRAEQYVGYGVKNATVEPVEGLGVPAIRNEFGVVAVEMAVGSQLVSVTGVTATFDNVRTLAGKVLTRMKSSGN